MKANEEAHELARLEGMAKELPNENLAGRIVSFYVADGKAHYLVVSEAPLVLQLIPFFDGYEIPDEMMRGLRVDGIRRLVRAKFPVS